MALIDINKNSLPEQVQENKEKIENLESTTATKTYVDDQDAATLQDAKDYADLAAAGALGDAKTYTDSGLALKQNALTDSSVPDGTIDDTIGFDSDGNLVKGSAGGGGGGLTLLWSGSLTGGDDITSPITFDANKKYIFMLSSRTDESYGYQSSSIIKLTSDSTQKQMRFTMSENTSGYYAFARVAIDRNTNKITFKIDKYLSGTSIVNTPLTIYLKEIYEVN